ncbi:MAG: L-aspartate oxidase [Ignavibacteria bacterium]|nr:L-aspartate oxidase [Ignavibacteria bacterium]
MEIKTDILVLGSGIAGLYATMHLAKYANVVLITKKAKTDSNTNYAQGGIASVFADNDSYESHIQDTLVAGAGLCDRASVEILVNEGPEHIKELIRIGTRFTMKENGLALAKEGGHSFSRIVHAQDLTGREVERALIEHVSKLSNVTILENHLAIDLITEHNIKKLKDRPIDSRHCWGAYVLDITESKVLKIISKATVISTGGLGQVYQHTTNPSIATGDGFAIAFRAGATLGNMEFIQFHPTSLYQGGNSEGEEQAFLISEAVRGFGGILRTIDGERFMSRYDSRLELAPRDIVARAIDSELKKRGDEFVYLDVTNKSAEAIKDHFPNIYTKCLSRGIDITKEMIPVVPAAHYACGGIVVDHHGKTSLTGLFASGEVTMTGVHGANRLASNSLLEALVFSARAAQGVATYLQNVEKHPTEIPDWDDSGTLSADEKVLISHSQKELKQLMWDYVGIVRSNLRLDFASRRISNLYQEVEDFYKKTKVFPSLLELRNLITCSHLIVKSGLMRTENRGLHYSLDYVNARQAEPPVNTILRNTYQKS